MAVNHEHLFQSPQSGLLPCNSVRIDVMFGDIVLSVPSIGAIALQRSKSGSSLSLLKAFSPLNRGYCPATLLTYDDNCALCSFQSPQSGLLPCNYQSHRYAVSYPLFQSPQSGLLPWTSGSHVRRSCQLVLSV